MKLTKENLSSSNNTLFKNKLISPQNIKTPNSKYKTLFEEFLRKSNSNLLEN